MGHRGDFDEIEPLFPSEVESISGRHDAELIPLGVDYPDFRDTDAVIEAWAKIPLRMAFKLSVVNRRSSLEGRRDTRKDRLGAGPWSGSI